MFTGPVGSVEIFLYWLKAFFENFLFAWGLRFTVSIEPCFYKSLPVQADSLHTNETFSLYCNHHQSRIMVLIHVPLFMGYVLGSIIPYNKVYNYIILYIGSTGY